jgi:hypothetical protein
LHRVGVERCHAWLVGHGQKQLRHARFLDDGQIITVSEDGTARQWNPPYDASPTALACELESHLFGHGEPSPECRDALAPPVPSPAVR